MSNERLSPIRAMRRHVTITVLLVLVGAAAGVGLALLRPTVYTAEARLAVGGNAGLAAEAVPGYALASQQLAANYARYVNNAQGQASLEKQLGIRPGIVQTVSASPIPESNIVRIEVTARLAGTAKDAASAVATSLVQQVNDTSRTSSAAEATLAEYTKISGQVAVAQQASDAAKAALARAVAAGTADAEPLAKASTDAAAQLAILGVQQEALADKYRNQVSSLSSGAANLISVEDPAVTGDSRAATMQQFGLAGVVVGFLVALLVAVGLERRGAAARNRLAPSGASAAPDVAREPVADEPPARVAVGPAGRVD